MTVVMEDRPYVTKVNLASAKNHGERVKMIADAKGGPDNVTTAEVVSLIQGAGVKVSRQTVSGLLSELRKNAAEKPAASPAQETTTETPSEPVKPSEETTKRRIKRPSGQVLAYMTLSFGILLSMGANVAHAAWVVPAHTGDDPNMWAVGSAAVWPLLLFLALEIMTSVKWTTGRSKWVRIGATSVIAVVAAVVSYKHASALLLFWGEDPIAALVGPVAIDGLVAIAALALSNNRRLKD